ncbi:hypothetical protein CAEBREN_10348 [Caenorhabditis brenneri]|uniref:Uncharacterized protein n=1 Tax=Caenorhabditis brenneri TaxID=135651 RepID=G0N484_CAEBE|nr:hypothetical protein CAEBREN_10348 [Caenorhabditis brenneri]
MMVENGTNFQKDSAMVKLKVTHNKFASGFRSNGKKESSEVVKEEKKQQSSHSTFPSSWTPAMFCPSGSFPQNAYSMATSQMNNQFFHAFQANAGNPFFWNPHNLVDTTQKRQSLSSSSDVSTSGTVTPPAGEQQLDSLSPTVFNYNGCFPCPQNTPAPFPRQNQSNDSSEMKPLDSFCWNFEQNSTSAMEWNNAFNTNGFIKNENIGNSF